MTARRLPADPFVPADADGIAAAVADGGLLLAALRAAWSESPEAFATAADALGEDDVLRLVIAAAAEGER